MGSLTMQSKVYTPEDSTLYNQCIYLSSIGNHVTGQLGHSVHYWDGKNAELAPDASKLMPPGLSTNAWHYSQKRLWPGAYLLSF